MDGYAGDFLLATPVEAHPAGSLVQVTVSAAHRSRLVLDFSDRDQVLTDACVLLCGHIGALKLVELGYTGPLSRRPRLAAGRARKPPDGADAPSEGPRPS
jgi:hypothetical protein